MVMSLMDFIETGIFGVSGIVAWARGHMAFVDEDGVTCSIMYYDHDVFCCCVPMFVLCEMAHI
jgi:hypothetical protein